MDTKELFELQQKAVIRFGGDIKNEYLAGYCAAIQDVIALAAQSIQS